MGKMPMLRHFYFSAASHHEGIPPCGAARRPAENPTSLAFIKKIQKMPLDVVAALLYVYLILW